MAEYLHLAAYYTCTVVVFLIAGATVRQGLSKLGIFSATLLLIFVIVALGNRPLSMSIAALAGYTFGVQVRVSRSVLHGSFWVALGIVALDVFSPSELSAVSTSGWQLANLAMRITTGTWMLLAPASIWTLILVYYLVIATSFAFAYLVIRLLTKVSSSRLALLVSLFVVVLILPFKPPYLIALAAAGVLGYGAVRAGVLPQWPSSIGRIGIWCGLLFFVTVYHLRVVEAVGRASVSSGLGATCAALAMITLLIAAVPVYLMEGIRNAPEELRAFYYLTIALISGFAHMIAWYALAWAFALGTAGYLDARGRVKNSASYYLLLESGLRIPRLAGFIYGLTAARLLSRAVLAVLQNSDSVAPDITHREIRAYWLCNGLAVITWALIGLQFAWLHAPDLIIPVMLFGALIGAGAHIRSLWSLYLVRRPASRLWNDLLFLMIAAVGVFGSVRWIMSELAERSGVAK